MKINNADKVYDLFDRFIEQCLLSDNSILSTNEGICTLAHLEEVKKRFIDGEIKGSGSDYWKKINQQFSGASLEVKLCFAHCNWLWYLGASDITKETKRETPKWILNIDPTEKNQVNLGNDYYPDTGIGSTGQYHKTNKPFEIRYIILLCIDIKKEIHSGKLTDKRGVKKVIIEKCLEHLYSEQYKDTDYAKLTNQKTIASCNILLHLADPDFYEPIIAERDKNNIITAFYHLVNDSDEKSFISNYSKGNDYELNREDKVFLIREALSKLLNDPNFRFYEKKIKAIWNFEGSNKIFSSLQALMFKKAVILFGPPGTGKTYEAQQLSSALISQQYIHKPERLEKLLKADSDVVSKRVHEFQFSPNTSYEEFIVGYQIEKGETKPKKGKLLEVIDAANDETEFVDNKEEIKMPHVLILDEINRVDLSRVFGEVLSLLEYRDKSIPTSISGISISIPNNLHLIGTMNEIDFSLERLDFALRRRFLWLPISFDKNALYSMLETRLSKLKLKCKEDEILDYVERCDAINNYIVSDRKDELGEKFQIGHAFFSDIADILSQQKTLGHSNIGLIKKKTVSVLWEISIRPLLDSYLGNIDGELKSSYLDELKEMFIK